MSKFLKINDRMTMVDEDHLGGFIIENDPATFTPNLWEFLVKEYSLSSVVDIGCGMGYALNVFLKFSEDCVGIDGSEFVQQNSKLKNSIVQHDFSKGPIPIERTFDLAWSCEFLEHVEEKYVENYIGLFKQSKCAAVTYADVGQQGHYHVNCQNKDYWVELFESHGLIFQEEETAKLREVAHKDALLYNPQYKDNHFYNRGLFFKSEKLS